jgi:peptidoglycan DL-endopeptidase CwlO
MTKRHGDDGVGAASSSRRVLPIHARMRARVVLLGIMAVAALHATASAASGGELAQKRAQARVVERQIRAFDARLDGVVQRYDRAASNLDQLNAEMRVNRRELRAAVAHLKAAQERLAQVLVTAYKSSGESTSTHVLASGGISDLIDGRDAGDRIRETSSKLMQDIARTKDRIASERARLRVQRQEARRLLAKVGRQRRTIQHALRARRHLLRSIDADIRRIILAQQARLDALNAKAARRLAAGDAAVLKRTVTKSDVLGVRAARLALRYLGVPYVWGGASPKGFDCSGLIMYVYGKLGVSLPHYTGDQWKVGGHVSIAQLQPGDLVFFEHDLGHVAMYLGAGLIIEAPHTGAVVRVASLSERWFAWNYAGAVHIHAPADEVKQPARG